MWTCSKSATGLAHPKPWPSLEGSLSDASAFWSAALLGRIGTARDSGRHPDDASPRHLSLPTRASGTSFRPRRKTGLPA